LVALSVVGVTPSGSAVTALGNAETNQHCDANSNGNGFNVVQRSSVGSNSYVVPAGGGTLTSWSVMAGAPFGAVTMETAQFQVWRPLGGGEYSLVFISAAQTFAVDSGLHTFPLSPAVAVNEGDLLGLGLSDTDAGCLQSTGDTGDAVDALFGSQTGGVAPVQGSTYQFASPDYLLGWQVNIATTFVPSVRTLTVKKVVQGAVPAGTVFTVHVQCSRVLPASVHAQVGQTTVNQDLFFDASGQPTQGTNPTVTVQSTDTCHVAETASSGAQSVSYACSDNHTSGAAQCQANQQDVEYGNPGDEIVTVTVTNVFPAPAVVVQPAFTG
jgi:hypothetical protein